MGDNLDRIESSKNLNNPFSSYSLIDEYKSKGVERGTGTDSFL